MTKPALDVRTLARQAKGREKAQRLRAKSARIRLKIGKLEAQLTKLRAKVEKLEGKADRLEEGFVPDAPARSPQGPTGRP